ISRGEVGGCARNSKRARIVWRAGGRDGALRQGESKHQTWWQAAPIAVVRCISLDTTLHTRDCACPFLAVYAVNNVKLALTLVQAYLEVHRIAAGISDGSPLDVQDTIRLYSVERGEDTAICAVRSQG